VGIATGGATLWGGAEYYLTPLQERPFSPLHDLYAPTGLVGQGLGIIGTLMIASGVLLYALRKRVPWLSRVGKLRDWLSFHIFLCLLGPFLVLLHTTFKFGGLVAIAFWSMTLVVASGVVGRWVYVWIPKTINGRFLSREELRERMWELLGEVERDGVITAEQLASLREVTGVRGPAARARANGEIAASRPGYPSGAGSTGSAGSPQRSERRRRSRSRLGVAGALLMALRHRLGRRKARKRLHASLAELGVPPSARPRLVSRLEEQTRIQNHLQLLDPFQRAFRYWHAFHLPLAVVMVLVLVVHVGVAVAFGYTWIF